MAIRAVLLTLATLCCCAGAQAEPPAAWRNAAHRVGICGEIKKLDALLYENPSIHGRTATCSTSTNWILVKPNQVLPDERMRRFVLLAFATTGMLFNEDFAMPDSVYAGFGRKILTTGDAALLQRGLKRGDDSGLMHALQMASGAQRVPCPK